MSAARKFRHLVLVCCLFPIPLAAQLERDGLPILSKYCFECHSDPVRMGDLDLRTSASMLKGGNNGPALVMGSAEKSLFYQRIVDKSMPLGDRKVSDAEARIIRDWINSGALTDTSDKPLGKSEQEVLPWAFRPLAPQIKPLVPQVKNMTWIRTPVDAFILGQLKEKGIQPAPPAAPLTLLRRVYLDLIGLPPTPEEQRAFLQDKSPNAYEKVVEALLSRPQYGERWARHWLDVVRYAESNGYERDGTKPHAWRYRDYVIDSFNKDKPYDRLLIEQLAGDEIEGSNAETQIATTFLRLGTWDDEPAEQLRDRYDQLDDVLGVTATAFLGQTLRCARCHDHKFEPFTQKDYYRMLAVFEPLKRPLTERIVGVKHPQDLDRFVGTEEELAAYHEATAKADGEIAPLKKQIENLNEIVLKRLFASEPTQIRGALSPLLDAETILAFRTDTSMRTTEQTKLVKKFNAALEQEIHTKAAAEERSQLDELNKRIADINADRLKEPPRAYVWYEESPIASPTYVLERGDPGRPDEEVQPGLPTILDEFPLAQPKPTQKSTGRRLWLARWMTRPDNPLVARVMVNRIWGWHFGEGVVASENNFGLMGERPSHAELLDYLAREFIQSGWSIKHIHRLIVKSNTFQTSSVWNKRAGKIDPDNALLWRWKPRRLEAEVIRDSMLAISGQLNLEMGGPSVYPPVPASVLEASLSKQWTKGWGKSDERQAARRSIYLFVKRSMAIPELQVLDAPDTTSSCEQRLVSTTGPQALTFMNGGFAQQQAGFLAARLEREAGEDVKGQVSRAFELAFSRPPRAKEVNVAREFLAAQQRQIEADAKATNKDVSDPRRRALEAFCLVLLNTNEFFYLN